eukprot:GFKZ01014885.1.p1 GENE.GFKZ01014885.1~~GFKZ01014885.1.p1  ORF type:complete len:203 (+),score=13.27 GFKZ01014885.1:257-865(+)
MATHHNGHTTAVNRFCEFLVVATHAILHKHAVYPARMFSPHRKYNLPTPHSNHPILNAYIIRTITRLRPWLTSAKLESIAIPIFESRTGHTIARYVFDVIIPANDPVIAAQVTATHLASLDVQLRAHLARILAEKPVQSNLELSWDYVVRTAGVVLGEEWVPADGMERREVPEPRAVPLKDSDLQSITLQICSRVELPGEER